MDIEVIVVNQLSKKLFFFVIQVVHYAVSITDASIYTYINKFRCRNVRIIQFLIYCI